MIKMATIEELKELEDYKHDLKMVQLEYARKTANMIHQQHLEAGRIKNAEYKKNLEREHYHRVEEIKLRDSLIRGKKRGFD